MTFFLIVLLIILAAASTFSQFVTKQVLPSIPEGWQFEASAPGNHQLTLHIRLKEENLDKLERRVLDMSNPDHAEYGKHLTRADVDAMTAPTKDTVDSVIQWLSSHGLDAGTVKSGYLSIAVTVDQATRLLDANWGIFAEATTGRRKVRTTSYSLPHGIHGAITMIQPTTIFSEFGNSKKNLTKRTTEALAGTVARGATTCITEGSTPKCLRKNYNIGGYAPSSGRTTFGIPGFLGNVPDLHDLGRFLQTYTDVPSNTSVQIISINNGSATPGGDGEGHLATQTSEALIYPIESRFYSTGGQPPFNPVAEYPSNDNEPYLDWLQYTFSLENPPQTLSISYSDDERTVPADYKNAVCAQFLKLAARGISVLTGAGDYGVGGNSVCESGSNFKFLPEFPSTCPWVTSVGGTHNYGANEEAHYYGGGGFSNHFMMPDYQVTAVQSYIKKLGGRLNGSYNTSGRAYPDLSAAFDGYPVFIEGSEYKVSGTSAATPAVASIIALLNDYLVSNGNAPLGFLNPFLYKKGQSGLRDIVNGFNTACDYLPAFPAGKGWDAVTGLGVPDFEKLKKLL